MTLPHGTVTFLFTDIEGSTRLFQQVGDRYATDVLVTHRRLLRDAIEPHNGHEVDAQGDALSEASPDQGRSLLPLPAFRPEENPAQHAGFDVL